MPGVPPCGLGCRAVKATKYIKENLEDSKKTILVYSIFCVLLAEIVSYFFRYEKNYACYIFPLISQLEMFLIIFSIYLWNDRLRFCLRKKTASLFLSFYFLIGFLSLLSGLTDSIYTTIISCGLLGISIITFLLSFLKSE